MPILVLIVLCLLSCQKKEEAPEKPKTELGLLELAPSKHYQDTAPASSPELDVTQTPDLAKIPKGSALKIAVHPLVNYADLYGVLEQTQKQHTQQLFFAVRSPKDPPTRGWLRISDFSVVGSVPVKLAIAEEQKLPWTSFTEHWGSLYEICRAESQDCTPQLEKPSQEGSLQVELSLSHQGVRVNFQQVDPPAEQSSQRVQVMDFDPNSNEESQVKTLVTKKAAQDIGTEAWFTFRPKTVMDEASALTEVVSRGCGKQRCTVRIKADPSVPAIRLLSTLGAAFPDGSNQAMFAFVKP
ncbi:MAG: hypothetical protein IPJ88_06605 [Myxococcales bacterium]|nr:MAG: hypothetical protein IPJ88_06605 [Myxococcales bacterium]